MSFAECRYADGVNVSPQRRALTMLTLLCNLRLPDHTHMHSPRIKNIGELALCNILYFHFPLHSKYSVRAVEKIISKVKDTFSVSVEIIQGNLKKLKKIISEKRFAESRNYSLPEKFSIFSYKLTRFYGFLFFSRTKLFKLSPQKIKWQRKKEKLRFSEYLGEFKER